MWYVGGEDPGPTKRDQHPRPETMRLTETYINLYGEDSTYRHWRSRSDDLPTVDLRNWTEAFNRDPDATGPFPEPHRPYRAWRTPAARAADTEAATKAFAAATSGASPLRRRTPEQQTRFDDTCSCTDSWCDHVSFDGINDPALRKLPGFDTPASDTYAVEVRSTPLRSVPEITCTGHDVGDVGITWHDVPFVPETDRNGRGWNEPEWSLPETFPLRPKPVQSRGVVTFSTSCARAPERVTRAVTTHTVSTTDLS